MIVVEISIQSFVYDTLNTIRIEQHFEANASELLENASKGNK